LQPSPKRSRTSQCDSRRVLFTLQEKLSRSLDSDRKPTAYEVFVAQATREGRTHNE